MFAKKLVVQVPLWKLMRASFAFSVVAFMITPATKASEESGRALLLRSAHHFVPYLVKSLDPTNLTSPSSPDRAILTALQDVVSSSVSLLVFDPDPRRFLLAEGEPPRLMRTTHQRQALIYVNETLLHTLSDEPDILTLVSLLLHEYGHKTEVGAWGE